MRFGHAARWPESAASRSLECPFEPADNGWERDRNAAGRLTVLQNLPEFIRRLRSAVSATDLVTGFTDA